MSDPAPSGSFPKTLSRESRRVLGVLIEKGFTTPDQYPLTLKATTSGANQKNNRDPVTNYTEEAIEEALEQLRAAGIVAPVHTDGGRTERFRHYVRKLVPISECQLAVLGELLLRGRQQVGELRSRASRMFAIESLEDLRGELKAMLEAGWIQVSGPLDRRGVEVDHTFYAPSENRTLAYEESEGSADEPAAGPRSEGAHGAPPSTAAGSASNAAVTELQEQMTALSGRVERLEQQLDEMRKALGIS